MHVLKRAHAELFRRGPDECFGSLNALATRCRDQQQKSTDRWIPPGQLKTRPEDSDTLVMELGGDGVYRMNDWSFTQLCQLAKVSRETVNRLRPDTAWRVFEETMPQGNKPLQILTEGSGIRSIHGVSYTRLYNTELVSMIQEFSTDFQPPQQAAFGGNAEEGGEGGSGLYAGEQDMFAFLIDPTGWAEIGGQAFAPGFFIWNSEVGKRSLGIETFWFQAVCRNHIVWDATDVVEFSRKHTANVHDSLAEMRRIVEALVEKRDARRDGFVRVMRNAMETKLGDDADGALKVLADKGIGRTLAKKALEIATEQGRFTIFAVVDALTRLAGESAFAGERTESDRQAAKLLELAV
jgi:histone H3/H4